jgi:hypothetical protein
VYYFHVEIKSFLLLNLFPFRSDKNTLENTKKIYFSGLNRHGDVANNTAHWSNADKEEVNLESGLWENGQPNLNDGKCGIGCK